MKEKLVLIDRSQPKKLRKYTEKGEEQIAREPRQREERMRGKLQGSIVSRKKACTKYCRDHSLFKCELDLGCLHKTEKKKPGIESGLKVSCLYLLQR